MTSPYDNLPSDTEPDATVRHLHCDLRQRIDRFRGTNVVEFRPRQMAQQQTLLDLANAFRSMELAKYDGDDNEPR